MAFGGDVFGLTKSAFTKKNAHKEFDSCHAMRKVLLTCSFQFLGGAFWTKNGVFRQNHSHLQKLAAEFRYHFINACVSISGGGDSDEEHNLY